MKVEYLRQFSRDLDKISVKAVKTQVLDLILTLEATESLQEIPHTKKLKGHRSAYRISDYRVGIFLESDTVLLARILHRKDIYKTFP